MVQRIAAEIRTDLAAARARDPATRGVGAVEILATWPGIHAVLGHRVAHALEERGVPLLPRILALLVRATTGIEIHPAARIGHGLFIDHGSGVVIGETAVIGENVTMYQGVTLGGTGMASGKRHPTVEDNVTIGSGAKLLGPITVGHGAKVGANTVVITDVPPNTTVVGNPGHPVRVEGRRPEGPDTDWIHLPDPIAQAIERLARRIGALEEALGRGSGAPPARDGATSGAKPPPGASATGAEHSPTPAPERPGERLPPVRGRDPAGG
jgi:serine O-acetyltransferase